jgi:hypothetical protein
VEDPSEEIAASVDRLERLGRVRWDLGSQLWGGRSQIEQFETDGAAGHIEGLTLRLFNPQSHQWRLYWANSKTGVLDPPQIGRFANGVGEFYAQDTVDGKVVLVRFVWSKTASDSPHFEQSFSADGGKTWEVNWITDQTRLACVLTQGADFGVRY